MATEEISVLYNATYGGWAISNKAIQLYNCKMKKLNPEFTQIIYNNDTNSHSRIIKRDDLILLDVYNELGRDFDESYSHTKINKIPKIYENHYGISEYDGLENVYIDISKYKLDTIKKIINNNISSEEKINEIKLLLE